MSGIGAVELEAFLPLAIAAGALIIAGILLSFRACTERDLLRMIAGVAILALILVGMFGTDWLKGAP